MAIHRVVSAMGLLATRRVSQMRPSSALAVFICLAGVLTATIYKGCVTLVLLPLAKLHFKWSARVASADVSRSMWDPSVASQFMIGASQINRIAEVALRQQRISYAALPLRRPEVDIILSQLRPSDTLLEFGASATTLAFPYFVNQTYSVEYDENVCNAITDELRLHHDEIQSKVESFCIPAPQWTPKVSPLEEGSYNVFKQYVDFPRNNLTHLTFDRVLINGRARVACALRILPQLKRSSLIFFHDFFLRPAHYASVLQYYDEVARVVAHRTPDGTPRYTDEPMGLLVLKPKPQYIGLDEHEEVSMSKINAIYETYTEQPPSAQTTGIAIAIKYGLADSSQGGFPYYEMTRSIARQTTKARFLLDAVAFPFAVTTVYLVYYMFSKFFRDAITGASNHSKYTLPLSADMELDIRRSMSTDLKFEGTSSAEFVGSTGMKLA